MNDEDESGRLFQRATGVTPTPALHARLLKEVRRALQERDPSGRLPLRRVLDEDDLMACARRAAGVGPPY